MTARGPQHRTWLERAARGGLGALAVSSLAGCSLLFPPPTAQIVNRCDVDGDCAASSVCEPSAHACVTTEAPAYEVRAEITPTSDPLGGEPVPMLFDLGVLNPGAPLTIVAPVQVPVQGTARFDGAPISAQITFTRRPVEGERRLEGALAGTIAVRASSSTSAAVDFLTQLPGGATYDVYVEPQSEFRALLPPLSATLEVPSDTGVSFAIEYREDELVEVHGVVRDADSQPQEGLLVRMVDASGRAISSRASTDAEGLFTLVAPRGFGAFSFRVRGDSTRQDSSALLPAITLDASTLLPDADGTFTLLVPSSDNAMRLEGRVELPATLGMSAPAPGAQVHLRSPYVSDPETGLVGSLELDLTTDTDGRFVGYVLPGDYVVEIVSGDEDVGVLVSSLEVLTNPSGMLLGQLYTLPQRSILGGTVQLADGEPVTGSRIRATALGIELAGDPMAAALLNRSTTGLSGAMGEFRLPLDVGVYDLVVEMPAESGYAWHVEHDFGVGGSSAPLRRVMSVRAPHRVVGTARFTEGTALGGARVRLFALHPDTQRPIEIGAAECDEDGEFVALLPPALD
jgi:hypothetical protein